MLRDDLADRGRHVMTVCNACRYCEGYCPVFPAMEHRQTFAKGDLTYLANLCHNCGECLYACQYAPPHEFGIDVPRTLAEIRLASYQESCWPAVMRGAFTRQLPLAGGALAAGIALMTVLAARYGSGGAAPAADFYQIVPHHVMVLLFSAVAFIALAAVAAARVRFMHALGPAARTEPGGRAAFAALRDALTLRHLHGAGEDCASAEETRRPWRRWWHHCTFYGFALCFASTTVAAIYHVIFGWRAPYAYTSLPVVLGTAGGIGLLVGPAGLFAVRGLRDPALADPAQRGLDTTFMAMLFLTSATGLALLGLRERSWMPALLVVHLGFVVALFLMLPYGKFVHGIHRMTALVNFARESGEESPPW